MQIAHPDMMEDRSDQIPAAELSSVAPQPADDCPVCLLRKYVSIDNNANLAELLQEPTGLAMISPI